MKPARKPRWMSDWEAGRSRAMAAVFSPHLTLHFSDSLLPHVPDGLAGFQYLTSLFDTAFPDLRWTILLRSGQGATDVITCVGRGTHRGPFIRVPPTKRRVTFPARFMTRTHDGKIVELWVRTSLKGLLPQLGMAPAEGS